KKSRSTSTANPAAPRRRSGPAISRRNTSRSTPITTPESCGRAIATGLVEVARRGMGGNATTDYDLVVTAPLPELSARGRRFRRIALFFMVALFALLLLRVIWGVVATHRLARE